jgi:hypothetical protein
MYDAALVLLQQWQQMATSNSVGTAHGTAQHTMCVGDVNHWKMISCLGDQQQSHKS